MKTFTSKTDLTEHVSKVHDGQKILFCLICEACFNCKMQLSDHMNRYHNKIVMWCNKCGFGFLNETDLNNHKLQDHGEKIDVKRKILSILKSEGLICLINPMCIPANIAANTKYGFASAPATRCSILFELSLPLGIRKATDLLLGPQELFTGTN